MLKRTFPCFCLCYTAARIEILQKVKESLSENTNIKRHVNLCRSYQHKSRFHVNFPLLESNIYFLGRKEATKILSLYAEFKIILYYQFGKM